MFDSESTNQLVTANEQNVVTTKSEPNSSMIPMLIPKVEPLSMLDEENDDQELKVSIPFTAPKLRDPTVLLERCDKIWETFKMIKDVQNTNLVPACTNVVPPEATTLSSYIKYQPTSADNGNVQSRFKFVVKNKKALFHCVMCGKQYKSNRDLRRHSYKIHNIFIPPKHRSRHSNEKTMKINEDCSNVTKDTNNLEKVPARNFEENPLSGTLQPVSECNVTSTTINLRMQRTLIQVRKTHVDNINKTVENKQEEKVLNKEVEPKTECVLCNQSVTNIKNHLITYHKIESPDFMLKNVIEAYPNSASEKVEHNNLNRTTGESEIVSKEDAGASCINPNKKRKLDVGNKRQNNTRGIRDEEVRDTYECEVCLGTYKRSSLYGHVRLHRARGETRENFKLSKAKYYNSAMYTRKTEMKINKLRLISSFCTSVNKSTESNKDNSNLDTNKKVENLKVENNDKNEEIARESRNKIQECPTQSNSDEISSSGITMAIKEKNDTSKVVHEDGSDNKSDHTDESSDISDQKPEDHVDTLDVSFDYSENHTVLKIQCVEEDIEIDIEGNSQTDFCNNTLEVKSKSKVNQEASGTEKAPKNIKAEVDREPHRKDNNSKPLKWELRSKKIINETQEKYMCLCKHDCNCGKQLYTKTSFDIHMNQAHTMTCGYCKQCFPDVSTWYLHECTVVEGKEFTDLLMELTCYFCKAVCKTYKEFDQHVTNEHFNHELPYLCFECPERFCTDADRKIHWNKKHPTRCSICNIVYKTQEKSKHKAYHCGFGIPCHLCKKAYINSNYYISHKKRLVRFHKTQKQKHKKALHFIKSKELP
ncbi:uncharacterized protein PFB0765w-like [Ceratina calcarata]|uniref:Uncharacterized protein PFB0765w-like n=1 Tax=Ceratina calcarata TaxID=156304 RepID=A0AAJ7J7V1_9HYME|nr:uncharacterized protein PFB0765w-like [Ceratina calcarata]